MPPRTAPPAQRLDPRPRTSPRRNPPASLHTRCCEGAVHEHGSERLVARRPSARHYHERRRDRKHQEHEGVHHLAKRSLKKRQQQKRRRRKRKQNLIQTHERNALVQEPPSCQQRDRSGKQPRSCCFHSFALSTATRSRTDAHDTHNERGESDAEQRAPQLGNRFAAPIAPLIGNRVEHGMHLRSAFPCSTG